MHKLLSKSCISLLIITYLLINNIFAAEPSLLKRRVNIEELTTFTLPIILTDEDLAIIDGLREKILGDFSVGIWLQDAATGKELYEYRAREAFLPASNAKVFGAAAALAFLGPDYQYQTEVLIQRNALDLEQQTLDGNLYVRFTGDPTLTFADLQALILDVAQHNIKNINGDIIIDRSYFQGPLYGLGWPWEDLSWYYAPPVSAIIIDQNQFSGSITKRQIIDQTPDAVMIWFGKQFPFASLNLDVETGQQGQGGCQLDFYIHGNNEVVLRGCWPAAQTFYPFKVAIRSPDYLAKVRLQQSFARAGININGEINFGRVPKNHDVLLFKASQPMTYMVRRMLTFSNNLVADTVTKTLGQEMYEQGSFEWGVKAVSRILDNMDNFEWENVRLFDGSGLSRYNLTTPEQMGQLLYAVYHDDAVRPYFMEALARSGYRGTLGRSLNSKKLVGKIRAKTGTLNGTKALSGYLEVMPERFIIFSVMADKVVSNIRNVERFEREVFEYLLKISNQ